MAALAKKMDCCHRFIAQLILVAMFSFVPRSGAFTDLTILPNCQSVRDFTFFSSWNVWEDIWDRWNAFDRASFTRFFIYPQEKIVSLKKCSSPKRTVKTPVRIFFLLTLMLTFFRLFVTEVFISTRPMRPTMRPNYLTYWLLRLFYTFLMDDRWTDETTGRWTETFT